MENSELFPEINGVLASGIRVFHCAENTPSGKNVPAPSPDGVRIERHPFTEFMFAVHGTAVFAMNNAEILVKPGTFCLFTPWTPHQNGYRSADTDLLHIWFGIHDHGFYFSIVRTGRKGEFTSLFRGRLSQVFLPVYSLIENDARIRENGCPERRIPFFNLLLSETREVLGQSLTSPGDPTKKEELTGALKYFIENHNGADCALETLEKHFGYSRSHLSHLFRDMEKISIGDYIDRVRMNYAIEAKKHGFKQKEIAAGLGFSSPSAFWLWLKKQSEREKSL